MSFRRIRTLSLVLLFLICGRWACAYAVLTHEELIDLTWQDSIVPLLLARYPHLTAAQLREARAYAYGGCVIQDIGYYPKGDRFFSNLTHYVRSGDFVVNLFRDAKTPDELAFAVGALSHYIGDSIGHPDATNIAVPLAFPTLKERYGPVVNYAEGEHQHVQVEFAFDIDQLAHDRLAPLRFQRRQGFKVPVHQLALAFYQTYGINDFVGIHEHFIKVRAYRYAVRRFIPHIALAVTLLHRHDEPPDPDTLDTRIIEREVARVAAQEHWSVYRRKPGFETHVLAVLIFILPKVGPLALVNIKGPTEQTEADYMHSLVLSLHALRVSLHRFTPPRPGADPPNRKVAPAAPLPVDTRRERLQGKIDPRHPLPNRDLDTGHVVQPGGYPLTDKTYAELLRHLARHPHHPVPPGIVRNIEAYYSDPNAPIHTKLNPKRWAQVQKDLKTLAAMPTSAEPQPYPTFPDNAADDE
ncbi:MAG: zinc dependent phospholipase C family protein [Acidobacteriota bacterium]